MRGPGPARLVLVRTYTLATRFQTLRGKCAGCAVPRAPARLRGERMRSREHRALACGEGVARCPTDPPPVLAAQPWLRFAESLFFGARQIWRLDCRPVERAPALSSPGREEYAREEGEQEGQQRGGRQTIRSVNSIAPRCTVAHGVCVPCGASDAVHLSPSAPQ
jgi:hypothetical protein